MFGVDRLAMLSKMIVYYVPKGSRDCAVVGFSAWGSRVKDLGLQRFGTLNPKPEILNSKP